MAVVGGEDEAVPPDKREEDGLVEADVCNEDKSVPPDEQDEGHLEPDDAQDEDDLEWMS